MLPTDIKYVYSEIRDCFSVEAYDAVALLSRTLLSSICVNLGCKKDLKFMEYIEWLDEDNYIPKNFKKWVDKIRVLGNKHAHGLLHISKHQALELIEFIEMILLLIYEYNHNGVTT